MENENPGPSRAEDLSVTEKNQIGLYDAVEKIVNEIENVIQIKFDRNVQTLIAELTWRKLKIYAQDLEAFSMKKLACMELQRMEKKPSVTQTFLHRKRTTIDIDDVKLLTRRNPSIQEFIKKVEEPKPKRSAKRVKKE